jgi:hypothetical protein
VYVLKPWENKEKLSALMRLLLQDWAFFILIPRHSIKGTEGQGLSGAASKYSRIALSFPLGLLFKFYISRTVTLGVELGLRKTTTDYIDDVSGNYYDNATLRSERGAMAADLADPNLKKEPQQLNETGKTIGGYQRGDPLHKDSYMFGIVSLNYSLYKFKRKFRARF